MTSERLTYRRQFFLAPLSVSLAGFSTWERREIARKYRLHVHPDLPLTHVVRGSKSLTAVGYLLDPDHPTKTDAEILEDLAGKLDRAGDLPLLTNRLGGRWAIVVHDGERTILFHDASGLRQVYYYRAADEGEGAASVSCASQPGLLAEVFGLTPDPAAVDYVRSRGDRDTEVYWLPGDTSPYTQVRALLPNHLIALEGGRAARYWPIAERQHIPYSEGLRESVSLLRGLVASARHRYRLAVAMTAGWDSRLMLALSKDAAADLYCYTLIYPNASEKTRDVYVPAKLLRKLAIEHHLLRYPTDVDLDFKAIARKNSSSVHPPYCADVQALRDSYPPERLCVTGDVAEVVKVHYRLPSKNAKDDKRLSAADLGEVSKVGDHPFAIAAFETWLAGLRGHEQMNVLDLFCWEQMGGRWHGQIRAEYDIVQESFAPLNCRALLLTMLAVDESYRTGPGFTLFRELIETLWKELLQVPINPKEKIRWRRAVVGVLNRLHIYELIPERAKQLGKRIVRKIA